MTGRPGAFSKKIGRPRTASVARTAICSTSAGGAALQHYDASLGCFVDGGAGGRTVLEGGGRRPAGSAQQRAGVRYMVKGHPPLPAQVARRLAAAESARPPEPALSGAAAAVAGQLVLRRAPGGRLVLDVGGNGDADQQLVLQVPDGAAGEQLVLQDGAGGEVVLQMPEDADGDQELILQDAGSDEVVLQGGGGGDGGGVVLQDGGEAGEGIVLQDGGGGRAAVVLRGGERGDEVVLQAADGDEEVVLQMPGDAGGVEHLVMGEDEEGQQELVLAEGEGGEVVLQVPEGSAGQEVVLQQEDGQQVVLQVPHGAAGPDGVIRLLQVTAEDGSVQYMSASHAAEQQFAAEAAPGPQPAEHPAEDRPPTDGADLAMPAAVGSERTDADSAAAAAAAPDGAAETLSEMRAEADEVAPTDEDAASARDSDLPAGVAPAGQEAAVPENTAVETPVAPAFSAAPLQPEAESTFSTEGLRQNFEPAFSAELAEPESGPAFSAERQQPESEGEQSEVAMQRLLSCGGEQTATTVQSQSAETSVGVPAAAAQEPTAGLTAGSPPLEPPPADEAPRGADPEPAVARGAGSDAPPPPPPAGAVCAVCGDAPRGLPLAPLLASAVRGSTVPLTEALADCLQTPWQPDPEQKVCASCRTLAGQSHRPGPLQMSASDHLRNIWALRCGRPPPTPSSEPPEQTAVGDDSSDRPPARRGHGRGRRGRGGGRRRRLATDRRRTQTEEAGEPSADGNQQSPRKKPRLAKETDGEAPEEEEAGTKETAVEGGDGAEQEEEHEEPEPKPKPKPQVKKEPGVKKEPEDDGPVKRTASGRRSRAPRAWSPDIDLTPRVKSVAMVGAEPARGKKRAQKPLTAGSGAVKRPKPKATMISTGKPKKSGAEKVAVQVQKTGALEPGGEEAAEKDGDMADVEVGQTEGTQSPVGGEGAQITLEMKTQMGDELVAAAAADGVSGKESTAGEGVAAAPAEEDSLEDDGIAPTPEVREKKSVDRRKRLPLPAARRGRGRPRRSPGDTQQITTRRTAERGRQLRSR